MQNTLYLCVHECFNNDVESFTKFVFKMDLDYNLWNPVLLNTNKISIKNLNWR